MEPLHTAISNGVIRHKTRETLFDFCACQRMKKFKHSWLKCIVFLKFDWIFDIDARYSRKVPLVFSDYAAYTVLLHSLCNEGVKKRSSEGL